MRHRPRQRDHIGELRMVAPGIERQPVRGELRHPGVDFGPGVHMGRGSARVAPEPTLTAAGHGSLTALNLTAMSRLPKVLPAIR
jgi:hypothetical protein